MLAIPILVYAVGLVFVLRGGWRTARRENAIWADEHWLRYCWEFIIELIAHTGRKLIVWTVAWAVATFALLAMLWNGD